jgi:iron complex transport system ATP-binding protein
MISTHGLTVVRSGRKLLDDVSIHLTPGTFSVIIGPNGAGKSTLMKVLSGEMRADAGRVTYGDVDVNLFKPVQLARLRAVLPQSTVLAFPFTALEIVRMGAVAQGSRAPEEQAKRALAKVGLSGFEGRAYNMLSGGEQQRVQFARALAQVPHPVENGEARALLLDEPTSSLDLGHQISVLETARDFAAGGGTVLAVLHDLNLAAEFADQLIVMHGGQITACGPSLETISDETIARVYGIGGTVGRVPAHHIPYVLPQSRHR